MEGQGSAPSLRAYIFLARGYRRRKSSGRRRNGRRPWMPGSDLSKSEWSRNGRSRRNVSGDIESGSSRLRSTGELAWCSRQPAPTAFPPPPTL